MDIALVWPFEPLSIHNAGSIGEPLFHRSWIAVSVAVWPADEGIDESPVFLGVRDDQFVLQIP